MGCEKKIDLTQADATVKNPTVPPFVLSKSAAAFRLGIFSRYLDCPVLEDVLLSLIGEIRETAFFALQRTLDLVTKSVEEFDTEQRRMVYDDEYREWVPAHRYSSVGKWEPNPQHVTAIRAAADQAFSTESAYANPYRLGAAIGDCLKEFAADQESRGPLARLLETASTLPEEFLDASPTLQQFLDQGLNADYITYMSQAVDDRRRDSGREFAKPDTPESLLLAFAKGIDDELEAAGPIKSEESGSKIDPEFRTRPMSYRRAAQLMGKANSRDSAESISKAVSEGSIRCDHISRQNHVFDKRDFPKNVWPSL
jgi:hypothetical protein